MKIVTVFFTVILPIALVFQSERQSIVSYKYDTGFIVQELDLDMHPQHHPQFAGTSAILSEYGEYFYFEEEVFLEAIRGNNFSLKLGNIIIEQNSNIYQINSNDEYDNLPINYSSGITQLLYLDDTGIIKLNDRYYVFRYLRYAYIDHAELKYKDREDGELRAFNSDNIRLFLYTQQLLPYPEFLETLIWKRKHELSIFWQQR